MNYLEYIFIIICYVYIFETGKCIYCRNFLTNNLVIYKTL